MRVALVCAYDCSIPGGVQTQVLGLARTLLAGGDEVLVVAPSAGPLGLAPIDGAPVATVGHSLSVPVNGSRAPVSPWPTTMRRTLKAIGRFAPDVVHVHEPLVPGPALAATLFAPPPLVGTFHRGGADRAYRYFGHATARAAGRLTATFAVSDEAAATARAAVGRRAGALEIVPNGVEVGRLAEAVPTPSDGPTVVFVGRHETRKGLGVLLEAVALLPPGVRIWVLGDGPESAALRRGAPEGHAIEWLGRVDDAERASRVAGADCYVAPSLSGESFGVVLLEAMAAGTAVVASDLPGYRLAAGGAARLVPPGDPVALAAALAEVLADEAARTGLEVAGRARAAACSMEAVAARYREAYRRIGAPGAGQ